ncbi:MAG: hypothetical protein ACLVEJ_01855 [Parabacteroides sp.]
MMRVGTLEQNGADRPQFIDTTVAKYHVTRRRRNGRHGNSSESIRKAGNEGEILVFPVMDRVLRQARGGNVRIRENLRVRFYLFGTAA